MITFLPYPDFHEVAACLDRQRLGKQRLEVLALLQAERGQPLYRHPACVMWRGHVAALASYGLAMCTRWMDDGNLDTLFDRIQQYLVGPIVTPPWLGRKDVHDSHKSVLLRKDRKYYGKFNWDVPINLPYVWPTCDDPRLFNCQRES